MQQALAGKIALVTGGAGGIGRAASIHFADLGAKVIVSDRDEKGAHETLRMLHQRQGEGQAFAADVSVEQDVASLIDFCVATFGRLDCAFNNAGYLGPFTPIADYSLEDWERVQSIDLRGTFLCLKHEIRAMRATGGGSIVNNSSGTALHGVPGMGPYSAAKAGILSLTRVAAVENARSGIRVNAIVPGLVHTPMVSEFTALLDHATAANPSGRLAEPVDIAAAAAWLCSDAAAYVVGQTIGVDGGSSIG